MKKNLLNIAICFSLVMLVAGCDPVLRTRPIVPEGSKSCVADAKEAEISCRAARLPEFSSCMQDKSDLRQKEIESLRQNKIILNAQYDSCKAQCLSESHISMQTGKQIKNDSEYCDLQDCNKLSDELNRVNIPSSKVSSDECSYIYETCESEYKLSFERCGGTYETYCVENCDKWNKANQR